ncbi:hypothetical protein IQ249_24755 [Lusitaniella coriacea LEGE 07157]|uniref:Uncharacterized protein n=1 Tax=Lusitaniella coriacea LEGE 07157 TaxID=945747 RepID=A0A8J7E1T2_9CYAN|nr:hypothetical protein [Lusitaniella coriacea]MBE9119071.1 hypothetical protein [Lusitaniella coriacea LEGE 07157]
MSQDITREQLIAAFEENDDVKSWWESSANLPNNVPMVELLMRTLFAATKAQAEMNQGLSVGAQIKSYISPAFQSVSVNAVTGQTTFDATFSIVGRVTSDFSNSKAVNG